MNALPVGEPSRSILDTSTEIRIGPRDEPGERLVPALTIAAHPNPARVGDRLVLDVLATGREVALSRNAPELHRAGSAFGAPLADPYVSRHPIRIAAAPDGRIRIAGDGGASITIGGTGPPGEGVRLGSHCAIEVGPLVPGMGVPIVLADRIVLVLHLVDLEDGLGGGESMAMVGRGLGISRLRRSISRVSDLGVPVLVRGETGTGKELVARALHALGPRRRGPFVSVNLGTIPRELVAAELFGAVRGAYTGAARDREGYFRSARGGTLFLDELGEAPPEVQVSLLRVLETGELYPVGADAPVATNVRVITATDADLDAQIRDGRFRAPCSTGSPATSCTCRRCASGRRIWGSCSTTSRARSWPRSVRPTASSGSIRAPSRGCRHRSCCASCAIAGPATSGSSTTWCASW